MRKMITRTITATTIKSGKIVFEKGLAVIQENAPITVNGTLDDDKALKEARKAYGQNTMVTELNQVDALYEISVEDFIKYATKVEVEEVPQITNEELKTDEVKK